jgi:hypothetical protein
LWILGVGWLLGIVGMPTTIAIMRELHLKAIVIGDKYFLHVGLGFETLPSGIRRDM